MRFLNIYFLFLIVGCNAIIELKVVKDFIVYNLAGHPTLHQETYWNFDPNLGPRHAKYYQEVNGVHGEKAIERLGLGLDGNQNKRLVQQRARDKRLLSQANSENPVNLYGI